MKNKKYIKNYWLNNPINRGLPCGSAQNCEAMCCRKVRLASLRYTRPIGYGNVMLQKALPSNTLRAS
jgi:hypothetical protein